MPRRAVSVFAVLGEALQGFAAEALDLAQSPRSTTALGSIQVPPTHITLGTAR